MAKKTKKSEKPLPEPETKKTDSAVVASRLLLVVLILPLTFVFMPTMIFLCFSLIPTWVALLFGKGKHKYRYCGLCVGALNLAGSVYYLFKMWFGDHTMDAAVRMLTNPMSLMVIFSAATFGWFIFFTIPPIMVAYMQMAGQHRAVYLKKVQAKLLEEWGEEIAEGS